MDIYVDLLKQILPEVLITHFDLTSSKQEGTILHLNFSEKNTLPIEQSHRKLESKGFHKEVSIEDFPLRGKQVYLHVKRRRWIDKSTKEVIQRDWNMVAKGSRMTVEFATFLKVLNRY